MVTNLKITIKKKLKLHIKEITKTQEIKTEEILVM